MGMMNTLRMVILVMLFYAFGVTMISHSAPQDPIVINWENSFNQRSTNISMEQVSGLVQNSVESQSRIPVIELGALIFYSSNILLDLFVNFAFAIPEMIGILVNGVTHLLGITSDLFIYVQLFATGLVGIFYLIGIVEAIMNVRSRGSIV